MPSHFNSNDFETALEIELGAAFPPVKPMAASLGGKAGPIPRPREAAPVIRNADPQRLRAETMRADNAKHDAAIIALNGWRDVEVRRREAERDEIQRRCDADIARLLGEIDDIEAEAERRIAQRELLRAANLASLAVLSPSRDEGVMKPGSSPS